MLHLAWLLALPAKTLGRYYLYCIYLLILIFRNENKFLLSGLKVPKHQTWHERQAAYVTAVKDCLVKLNPDFTSIEVKFVRSMRVEPRLYLSVECATVFQYVILISVFSNFQ